jgi:uncharacterized protein YndB with AHSA1/START domain
MTFAFTTPRRFNRRTGEEIMKSDVRMDGKKLQITRVFEAPRNVVFAWFKQADKLQQWSGCKEATKCEIRLDFRVGGTFTQKMHIRGAGDFSFTGKYDEIVEPEKIAYHADLSAAPGGPPAANRLIEFFEQGQQTKVVLTQDGFPDEFTCKMVSQGTTESFDKLGGILVGQAK